MMRRNWVMTILMFAPVFAGSGDAFGALTIGLDAVHSHWDEDRFAMARDELSTEYTLLILNDFNPTTLMNCDAIFIGQADLWDERSRYTSSDIFNIHQFVGAGGGMVAFAEGGYYTDSTVENFNNLLAPYGVSVGGVSSGSGRRVTGFVPHAVTNGVNMVEVDYQRAFITIAYPAIDLTVGGGDDNILAAVDGSVFGAGNVAIVSDTSIFAFPGDDTNLYEHDNLQLLMNMASYTVPEPTTLLVLGLGGLIGRKRRCG